MTLPPIRLEAQEVQSLRILKEFAEFWKIPYETNNIPSDAPTAFRSGRLQEQAGDRRNLIVSPSGGDGARSIATKLGLNVLTKRVLVRIPVSAKASTSISTTVYEFQGPDVEVLLFTDHTALLSRISGTQIHLLSIDLVGSYVEQLYRRLEDSPSTKFRLATRLPFSYNSIPSFIRNKSFRTNLGPRDFTEERLGPVECLRTIFLASLALVARGPIPRVWFWKRGKSQAIAVTHDVETKNGLTGGLKRLKEVEKTLGIRSTWNVPSNRYPISQEDFRPIKEAGELGAHDTKHDGKLALLARSQIVERLESCKSDLTSLSGMAVSGFRSPLLQHNETMIGAIAEAGFSYDSSVPSWESLSPTSFKEHGAGTVFPFEFQSCLEIPVSLPQDHQLLRVMNLKPSAAVDLLLSVNQWIKGIGGAGILLVHPDYEFAFREYVPEYERLLHHLVQPECQLMTLSELATWWRFRSSVQWRVQDGRPQLETNGTQSSGDLEAQLVKGYGKDGFELETMG